MDPITLAIMGGMGLYSAYNKYRQGKSIQAQAEKARKRFDAMIAENKQNQEKATQQAAADATDVRTNYITTRDTNKAQGLAQMYQSGMSNFRNIIAGLKQENRELQAQREGIESPTNAEIKGGVAADLASTAFNMYGSYKAGQQANITQHNQNEFMKSITDSMHKFVPYDASKDPNSFGNQVSYGLQSFKNMFGDSNFTPKIDNDFKAPSIEIADVSERSLSKPTYDSGATKFYNDAFLKSDKWKRMKKAKLPYNFSSQLQFRSLGGD